ncbi:MAG: hypothetical protein Ct9H300mP21_09910 [Pseudomonadota bacterium]|nr:MAG: hypothetical protein Ct9H300mP21_09910 [Pseudomonadota bacterium]
MPCANAEGRGGGKPNMAQAGIKAPEKLQMHWQKHRILCVKNWKFN